MINFPGLLNHFPQLQANAAGLIRRLQTTVEHIRITNVEPTANIEKGEVFCLTAGKRNALLAVGTSALLAEWVGVACEPTIEPNESGIGRTNGKAYCLFEPGLDPAPAANDRVYLSASIPGRMTNVETAVPGTYISSIGYITESNYAEDGSCMVQLQRCCFPIEPQ